MPFLPAGFTNPNAIGAPGVYVITQPPQPTGPTIPTSRVGIVGTASWGPLDTPHYISSITAYINLFGTPQTTIYDMGTHVALMAPYGVNDFVCVRVADGTEAAAFTQIFDTTGVPVLGMTLTSRWTGTLGNSLRATVSLGSNSTVGALTYKLTIQFPVAAGSSVPEIFDNIPGTGLTLWQNLVNAVNLGTSSRAPSQFTVATIGTATATPALVTYSLAGGVDGNSGVTEPDMIGVDGANRTAMYALRETLLDYLILPHVVSETHYQAQMDFALFEGCEAIITRPQGEAYTTAITAKNASVLNTNVAVAKVLIGDFIKINDPYNNIQRFISPQSLAVASLALLDPNQSGLNKQIPVIGLFLGTQSSDIGYTYSGASIDDILHAGLDVISKKPVGGNYFTLQTGKNNSNLTGVRYNDDFYIKLTAYIGRNLMALLINYVGSVQSPEQRALARSDLISFLSSLVSKGWIGSITATNQSEQYQKAFTVVLDASNNPQSSEDLGIEIANVRVCYFGIAVWILVNLQTGLTSIDRVAPE